LTYNLNAQRKKKKKKVKMEASELLVPIYKTENSIKKKKKQTNKLEPKINALTYNLIIYLQRMDSK
jgi:hypothetical protein